MSSNPSLSWTPSLSVGNQEVDHQHQELIEKIKALPDQKGDVFLAQVEQLLEHCFEHFKTEEEWMRQIRYPGYREHIQCHNRLGEQFHGFFSDYNSGRMSHEDFLQALHRWITDHIAKEDVKIGAFVNSL